MPSIRVIGDEVLREVAKEVTEFDDKLKNLANEMIDIMHDSEGIGLAAPQIAISIQLLVINISSLEKGSEPRIFVNPEIIESWGEATRSEGCLSIPGVQEEITRPEEILLKYNDVSGEQLTEKFDGWMSRVLQHEIDHLKGILFIDYLSPIKQKLVLNQFSLS